MTSTRESVRWNRIRLIVMFSIGAVRGLNAQSTLTIQSPAAGTIVSPGQSVTISVSVGPPGVSRDVALVGEIFPEPAVKSGSGVLTFDVTVPQLKRMGKTVITAIDITSPPPASGGRVTSPSWFLNVEQPDSPTQVTIDPVQIGFRFVGGERYFTVAGKFLGGAVDLSRSARVTFRSSDLRIATVSADGLVTAVGAGRARIDVLYAGAVLAGIPVTISGTIRGDLDGDTDVDQADLNILRAWLNRQSSGSGDARDLNGDGKIDDVDLQIMTTLCSRPSCAISDGRLTPGIIWPIPAPISYGTPLSVQQLAATSSVPGTFTYAPSLGTVLGFGSHTLSVTFTPNDQTSYSMTTASVKLQVNKAQPTISWPKPIDIAFGTAIGAGQLNALSNVPGVFTYSPALGTVLTVGNGRVLSATFQPTDGVNYSSVAASTQINVLPSSGSTPRIIVTTQLSRNSSNDIVVRITLANSSAVETSNAVLTSVRIGIASGTPIPQSIGTIPPNSMAQATVTVSGNVGGTGTANNLTVTGSYTGGTLNVAARVTLP